jgi:hypothetical protein
VQAAEHRHTLREVTSLDELAHLVRPGPRLFVRWLKGPDSDRHETSCDHASGLELPGLAVNPLEPPTWWTRPVDEWVARQITAYDHLGADQPDHIAWVLSGRVVERGPDNEPLVANVEPVARLTPEVLHEATARAPESSRTADDDTSWRS